MSNKKILNGWRRLYIVIALIYLVLIIILYNISHLNKESRQSYVYYNWSHGLINELSEQLNKPSYKVRDEIFKNLNNKEVVENFNERISGYFLMIQLINTLNAAADVEDHKSAKIIAKAIGNTKVKVFKVKNLNPEIKSIIIKYNIKNSGLLLNNISYMTEQINNKYKRKLQDAQKIQWHSIWDSFLIWLIPMIILYLLGEGINWVRKGFKKSSQ